MPTAVGWDDDPAVAARPALPALRAEVSADVCVVGLGGSGLAAVGAAVQRGLSVVGVDAGRAAAGAAGRNGGFLLGGPALAAHDAAKVWGSEVALGLYRETLAELDALTELLGPEVIRRVGSIRLAGLPGEVLDEAEAKDRAAEVADCQEQFAFLRAHSIAVERYEGPLGVGLFLPDDAAMNPARRALALAALYGVDASLFENSPVTSIERGRVLTAQGSVSAGLTIVAVDGRLELLLPELAGRVRTARLQMLATAPIADATRLPCPVYGRWGYDYAQQDPFGRLFVGGGRDRFESDEWVMSAEPTPQVQGYLDHVAARFAGRPIEVTHRWGASVGYTPDGRPIVAEVRPGVVVCGGYSGTGNLVGPVAARAALALGLDGAEPSPYFATG